MSFETFWAATRLIVGLTFRAGSPHGAQMPTRMPSFDPRVLTQTCRLDRQGRDFCCWTVDVSGAPAGNGPPNDWHLALLHGRRWDIKCVRWRMAMRQWHGLPLPRSSKAKIRFSCQKRSRECLGQVRELLHDDFILFKAKCMALTTDVSPYGCHRCASITGNGRIL